MPFRWQYISCDCPFLWPRHIATDSRSRQMMFLSKHMPLFKLHTPPAIAEDYKENFRETMSPTSNLYYDSWNKRQTIAPWWLALDTCVKHAFHCMRHEHTVNPEVATRHGIHLCQNATSTNVLTKICSLQKKMTHLFCITHQVYALQYFFNVFLGCKLTTEGRLVDG